jgi:ABC-2 type transport system ATP-binding protein
MTAALETRNLTKHFGASVAVDDVSFSIEPGVTTGLLGGNGAGKTTTIAMLLGLIAPTAGEIRILGLDPAHSGSEARAKMNFQSPYVDMPKRLSVRRNLAIYAKLYGVKRPIEAVESAAEELQLTALLTRKTGSLSAGQATRVGIAKALINNPSVLLLDEPTASLDPDTADWVRGVLEAYQARSGAAILLASHNMGEVERLAGRVLMMKSGRIVDDGAPKTLIAKYGRDNLEEVFLQIARREEGVA